MPSIREIWEVARPILEFGVVGAILLLAILACRGLYKDLKKSQEARIAEEHAHSDAFVTLVRQMEATVAEVDKTLEELVKTLKED